MVIINFALILGFIIGKLIYEVYTHKNGYSSK